MCSATCLSNPEQALAQVLAWIWRTGRFCLLDPRYLLLLIRLELSM